MILVDTSIWIKHFRSGVPDLVDLLDAGRVLMHPMVVGELACGSLKNRDEILELLQNMPMAPYASDREVLHLIEARGLMSRGIGYVDMHLLAAVVLGEDLLWTSDVKLAVVAADLSIEFQK